jgi:amino acid transporter
MAVSTPRPDGTTSSAGGLRRSLSVWQAVGLSVALMAPSMAANINPQGTAGTVGRAVPLAFLLAAIGVLLVAYGFVRLCQYFHHAGSVYAFVGATLGPRTGLVSGFGLLGTYCFYGVVTSSATGIFGTAFLQAVGIWENPPSWAPFLLAGVALVGALALTIAPAKRGTSVLLTVEGATVALILVVSAIVLVRLVSGNVPADAPSPGAGSTLDVFTVAPGTELSAVFLGVVFGYLSFAGFEAAATLGEEARNPRRDIPRAILGTAVFGGIYFVVVTAIEMMGFGTDDAGVAAFASSPRSSVTWAAATSPAGSVTSSPWARRSARSAAAWPAWSAPPGSPSPSPGTPGGTPPAPAGWPPPPRPAPRRWPPSWSPP